MDLADLPFENTFVSTLPADPVEEIRPRPVRNACFTRVTPTPVAAPRLLAWSDSVGNLLGLSCPPATGQAAEVLGGNLVLPGMQPYAARYGGHQFGNWAGQLGDGRAITLSETIGTDGKRYELQLKGAGLTPYSRTADGRAVLRSSVREFMCSEAMHWLGVPTTRALSLVATGEPVVRDMFYDGNPAPEPGAIVCRVAPSFVRFGNFEILASLKELEPLRRLADYVVRQHFPEIRTDAPAPHARWFEEVCRRTAHMVVHWMRVGFVHGVMNTDNMSILGLTIDYGPYGWLEGYELQWTPNTTDLPGRRYCYGNQPHIAQWNLVRLANALHPLIEDTSALEKALGVFVDTFEAESSKMFASKLGLEALDQDGDDALLAELLEILQAEETDMTIFFRNLSKVSPQATDDELIAPLKPAFYADPPAAHLERLAAWTKRYVERVQQIPAARRAQTMNRANPKYVLRNYLAQQAIDGLEKGDASVLERLMKVLEKPYDEQPENEDLFAKRPEWARHRPGCSALSCSS